MLLLDELIAELVNEEWLEESVDKLVLVAKNKGKAFGKKKEGSESKKNRPDPRKEKGKGGKCTHCKRGVHLKNNCWKKHFRKNPYKDKNKVENEQFTAKSKDKKKH
ncbi:MAG: hypothetical protein M1830_001342 [Pleopsidium flavum]|nr:MAG: hypothetical protein M1830_001342 [Pleopsidium flavum]